MPCPDIDPEDISVFPQAMAFVLPPKEKWSDAFRHGYEEAIDLMRKSPRQRYETVLEWDEYSLGYQHGINQKVGSGDISANGARELLSLPRLEDSQAETRGFNEAQNNFQPHPNDLKREPYVRGFKQGAIYLYQEGRASRMAVTEKLLKIGFVPTDEFFNVPLIPAVPAQSSSGEIRTVSSTGGEKGSKPQRYDLIPVGPLNLLAELYGKGAEKYAEHNFRKGYNWSLSYAAAMRHLTAFWNGEDIDPEMGLPHVICAAFHMFALAEFMKEHPEFDDRYIRELKEAVPSFPTEPSEGPYYPN